MNDLEDLYQQIILDHGTSPHNNEELADADRSAEGFNPLCGDRIRVFLKLEDGSIGRATFVGKACAICTASASLMTQQVKHSGVRDVRSLIEQFRKAITEESTADDDLPLRLQSLLGVRRFPMRVKCATLPWHTLVAALDQKADPITTE